MICWVVTGAGHFAKECLPVMVRCAPFDLYLTRAAVEVLTIYGLLEDYERSAQNAVRETAFSAPQLVRFAGGKYKLLVIAPATSNTVAKCALGIADNVASTFLAQAGKSGVNAIVLPSDTGEEVVSHSPQGREIAIRPRAVDLRRVDELSAIEHVTVVRGVEALASAISRSL